MGVTLKSGQFDFAGPETGATLPAKQPDIWMIGRVDQFRILASHLAQSGRLARWDSFWRATQTGLITPAGRVVDNGLGDIPGRHLWPDILDKTARKLRLPAHNLGSDLMLGWLAARAMPKGVRLLHGQGNYSLPAMRRARQAGTVIVSDVTGQLAPIRERQLAEEYRLHNRQWCEISAFLARRRLAEARFADAIFAPSDAVAEGLVDCGIAQNRIDIIPFDAPLVRTILNRPPKSTTPEQHDRSIRLLYVGEISLAKGVRTLLQSFGHLRIRSSRPVSLTLIGRAKADAKHWLTQLPFGCEWIGPQKADAIIDHLGAADIFVFPSHSEGSSLAVMEAMASGLAIVTTPAAGSPIHDGHDGILLPPGEPREWAERLAYLIENPALCHKLGQAARKSITNLLAEGYGPRVEAAYDRVLTRHG
jgi:glycosyltransferase involved in cell wall biosynthesis